MLNNIAVLIDADNASAKTIDKVLQAIEKLGKISTKKIYGDWSMTGLSASWQQAILRHAIDPMQQFAYVKGKNATDIALVIEAMDLLHSGEYDGFCLISSDSDFASLAVRIRKSGVKVYGFGKKEAVISFRQACDEFFEVENLNQPTACIPTKQQPIQSTAWDGKKLKGDSKLLKALRDSITQNTKDDWANYSQIVTYFKKNHGDIDIKKYGYHKLIKVYQAMEDVFTVNNYNSHFRIRLKNNQTPQSNQKYTLEQLRQETLLLEAIYKAIEHGKNDEGWCNLGQVSSYMSQNYDIDIKKYGYKKFSELITAIRLFDIKKQSNGIYVKLKNQQPKPTAQSDNSQSVLPKPTLQPDNPPKADSVPQKPLTPDELNQTPLILNGKINVYMYRGASTDAVLWRLGDNKKVRHDGDMIFYGQTQSSDGDIELDSNIVHEMFTCQLSAQSSDIHRLVFSVSHECGVMEAPTKIIIEQDNRQLFMGEFAPTNDTAKSAILLILNRTDGGWRVVPRPQFVRHDLRELCTAFGVDVDD